MIGTSNLISELSDGVPESNNKALVEDRMFELDMI